MPSRRILVIEDEPKTSASIVLYLEHAGFEVRAASDGRTGLALARELSPDLIILDLMLPEIDGLAICRVVRSDSRTPIIMLTARSSEEDKLRGLELGADDYVTKPFSPRELVARVRAVLRRSTEVDAGEQLRAGDVEIDGQRHEARVDGRTVDLTATEFRLLRAMVRAPARVFTREELVARAFAEEFEGLDRTVDAHIKNLRRKIDGRSGPSRIATVFGVGYRFVPQ
jgi:two-component system alkaline phosphatase synthesis response regulator PhoP